MTNDEVVTWCEKHRACDKAIIWMKRHGGNLAALWGDCERADWMLWFAAMRGCKRELYVIAACKCARRALKYVPKEESRPSKAIETAERWCDGKATKAEVRIAACAADAYAADADARGLADAAAACAAAYAADAAACAAADAVAYAADAAACAAANAAADAVAYAAADAAAYAAACAADAYAAADAADAASISAKSRIMADIVRRYISAKDM